MPSILKRLKSKKIKKEDVVEEEKKENEVVDEIVEHDYTVTLPAGRIGIKFVGKPPHVTKVHDDSPVHGKIEVGHTICGVIINGTKHTETFTPTGLASLLKTDPEGERILLVKGELAAPVEEPETAENQEEKAVEETEGEDKSDEKPVPEKDEHSVGTSDDVDEEATKATEESDEVENDEVAAPASPEKPAAVPEEEEPTADTEEKAEPVEKPESPKSEVATREAPTETKETADKEVEKEEAAVEDSMKLCGISPAQLCGIGA